MRVCYHIEDADEEDFLTIISKSLADSIQCPCVRSEIFNENGTVKIQNVVEEIPFKKGDKIVGRYGNK